MIMMTVAKKIRTYDSPPGRRMTRARAIDTILSNVTDEELAAYFSSRAKNDLGKTWTGIFAPMLASMDRSTRDELVTKIDNYAASDPGGEWKVDNLGTLGSTGALSSNGTTDSLKDASLRQWRDQTSRQVEQINAQNERFWEGRGRS
jgi:hypothetical protein